MKKFLLVAALSLISTFAQAQSIEHGTLPTGPAGGVLAGTYPNPSLAASPTLITPIIGVAQGTSLALNGCTIGSNTLCTTGTINSSGSISTSVNMIAGAGGTIGFQSRGSITSPAAGSLTYPANAFYTGTIPVVTGTGTPTITLGSTDAAGEITSGTSATSVIITFSAVKANAPFCVVTPQTQLVAFAYTISTAAITITMTAATGEKIDYFCTQH